MQTFCNFAGWKNKYFEDCFYFDSLGKLWPVIETVPLRKSGILDRIFNLKFYIDIKLGGPLDNSFVTAQSYLIELILFF